MKRYIDQVENTEELNFRLRWGEKVGKVKLTDAIDDMMKDQSLTPESKKNCLKFMASLVDADLEPKDLDTLLIMLNNIKKENKGGWTNTKTQDTRQMKTSNSQLLKTFIGKSVPAYKFREIPNLEKIEALAGAFVSVLETKQSTRFTDSGKMNIIDSLVNKASVFIKDDQATFTALRDAIKSKAEEKSISPDKIATLLVDIEKNLVSRRPNTPIDPDVTKG